MEARIHYLILIFLLITYFTGLTVASWYNTDFGNIQVSHISIPRQDPISAYLYRPTTASDQNPYPTVIATHGISGSKEMLNGVALELAKNGFVTLTVDLIGHGDSGGVFSGLGNTPLDKTLGLQAVVHYLLTQSFVNSSQMGLVGHSLGAGAVRATVASYTNIAASVFIAGALDEMMADPDYGRLNSTFPKNLLIIVGEHDVLFDINQTKTELRPIFGTPTEIMSTTTYGRFSEGTARRLIIPKTTHLFEPVDPTVVLEILNWMKRSLKAETHMEESQLTYHHRELAVFVSGTAFTVLGFPTSSLILDHWASLNCHRDRKRGYLSDWQILVLWGTIGLLLFLPMFLIGSMIPFPPGLFGNAFSWWLLSAAVAGLLITRFILPNYTDVKLDLLSTLRHAFTLNYVIIGIGIFTLLYSIVHITETLFLTDLRISVIPLFNSLTNANRILVFWAYIPFYLVYFFVENLYLLHFRQRSTNPIIDLITTIALRTVPYFALLASHYLLMLLYNFRVFPSFLGFVMEFFVGMIPLFVISTFYSWWFYHKTNNLATGTTFNALLFAWSSAAVFPIIV